MKIHHWFITGAVALALLIGCATMDSHRAAAPEPAMFTGTSDRTAVGLRLVVDNDEPYVLDRKAVMRTLSPGRHRIALVRDKGDPPIDSLCISSDISLEAGITVISYTLRIVTDRGHIAMGRRTVETEDATFSPCEP